MIHVCVCREFLELWNFFDFFEPIFRLGNLNNRLDIKIDEHSLERAKPYMHLRVDLASLNG